MTKYYIKKRERKESFVWIYLNTCIWLSCSFVRCKGKMKLYSDLSDSEYGLHKFSAYPLFSGRLCNSQNKSMKTKQYVCAGKNNILGLAHKDSWRAGRFSWKKMCKNFTLLCSNYELSKRSSYNSILYYCHWTWFCCFLSLSEMACLTPKVSGQSTPVKSSCKKIARLGPLWRPFSSGIYFYNGHLLFFY